MVCRCVHMHTKKEELWIFSFAGLFHLGYMDPPGNDGVLGGFKTSQLWLLQSRVEPGGKEWVCWSQAVSQRKQGLVRSDGEWGNESWESVKKSRWSLRCDLRFLLQHFIIPSLFTYQLDLKTTYVMMVPVQFHSGKCRKVPPHPHPAPALRGGMSISLSVLGKRPQGNRP